MSRERPGAVRFSSFAGYGRRRIAGDSQPIKSQRLRRHKSILCFISRSDTRRSCAAENRLVRGISSPGPGRPRLRNQFSRRYETFGPTKRFSDRSRGHATPRKKPSRRTSSYSLEGLAVKSHSLHRLPAVIPLALRQILAFPDSFKSRVISQDPRAEILLRDQFGFHSKSR